MNPFAATIESSVGAGGVNSRPDVLTVQELLQRIPVRYGGVSSIPLTLDGGGYGFLGATIRRFQQQALNTLICRDAPGLVTPGSFTWRKLQEMACQYLGSVNCPDLELSGLREDILRIARQEMGRVHDYGAGVERHGWQRLKQYFDEALEANWGPLTWAATAKYTMLSFNTNLASLSDEEKEAFLASKTVTISRLDGVRLKGMRPPIGGRVPDGNSLAGAWNGYHWCGVFATWVLRQAGLKVKWGPTPYQRKDGSWDNTQGFNGIKNYPADPNIEEMKRTGARDRPGMAKRHYEGYILRDTHTLSRFKNILPGDVCVIAKNSHHFIVEQIDGDRIIAIAGNSAYQSIAREHYSLADVTCTYRTCP